MKRDAEKRRPTIEELEEILNSHDRDWDIQILPNGELRAERKADAENELRPVYNSHGPDGFWEHGHPPCEECLKYHKHIANLREGLVEFRGLLRAVQIENRGIPQDVADLKPSRMRAIQDLIDVALTEWPGK